MERDVLRLYHVCRRDQEKRILTYGIFHDESPTLTLSLVGAVAQAESYHANGRDVSILRANVSSQDLEICCIDQMGPGFLPIARKTRDQIPENALPYELVQKIFVSMSLSAARWLDPKYFDETIHRTSHDTVRYIFDNLRNGSSPSISKK